MRESKSLLELVLMPLAVTIVGIAGSLIISAQQSENATKLAVAQTQAAKEKADSDRQVKVLEIFSEKITGESSDREIALKFLRTLDSDLHRKLANAVAESESKNSIIAELARNEEARATQRRSNEQEDAREKIVSQVKGRTVASNICDKYRGFTREEWNRKFQKTTTPGTWHVFVASLGKGIDENDASKVAIEYERRFPNHLFQAISTGRTKGAGNDRYAIVIARGLTDEKIAREIARYADKCGIAEGAYPYRQVF